MLDYPLFYAMLQDDKEDSLADAMLKVIFAFTDFAHVMGQGGGCTR
jgi:hypothetical protein